MDKQSETERVNTLEKDTEEKVIKPFDVRACSTEAFALIKESKEAGNNTFQLPRAMNNLMSCWASTVFRTSENCDTPSGEENLYEHECAKALMGMLVIANIYKAAENKPCESHALELAEVFSAGVHKDEKTGKKLFKALQKTLPEFEKSLYKHPEGKKGQAHVNVPPILPSILAIS
ncbi:MAG: hypothetical protein H6868_07165 [Rhodospirillales bacterium]|nr:hypothetical protein [Rhodospirillales bacterium]